MIDEKHSAALRFLGNRFLCLALRSEKKNASALSGLLGNVARRLTKHLQGFLQVNNVDSVAFAEDVLLHLRAAAPRLVAEVNAGLQKLLHRNFDSQITPSRERDAYSPVPRSSILFCRFLSGREIRLGHGTTEPDDTPHNTTLQKTTQHYTRLHDTTQQHTAQHTAQHTRYRLLNWKRRRAPFCPYFLRSFMRESRVRNPFLRNPGRRSGFNLASARERPMRTAPDCPPTPPPFTIHFTSSWSCICVNLSGSMAAVSHATLRKYSSTGRPFTVNPAGPILMYTRATASRRRPVP